MKNLLVDGSPRIDSTKTIELLRLSKPLELNLLEAHLGLEPANSRTYNGRLIDFSEPGWTPKQASTFKGRILPLLLTKLPKKRSALVFTTERDFGLGRMIESYSTTNERNTQIRAFRSLELAIEWLVSS